QRAGPAGRTDRGRSQPDRGGPCATDRVRNSVAAAPPAAGTSVTGSTGLRGGRGQSMDCLGTLIDGLSSSGFGFFQLFRLSRLRGPGGSDAGSVWDKGIIGAGYLDKPMGKRQKKFLVELIKPSHYDDQ